MNEVRVLAEATQQCPPGEIPAFAQLSCGALVGRTVKRIKERWENHNDPSTCREEFDPTEDAIVLALVANKMGWHDVAQQLPRGRSASQVSVRLLVEASASNNSITPDERPKRLNAMR